MWFWGVCVHVCVSHSIMSNCLKPPGLYVVRQAPPSMGVPRQEHWSGLPFPFPGDLPAPENEPVSPVLADRFFTTEPPVAQGGPWLRVVRLLVLGLNLVTNLQ